MSKSLRILYGVELFLLLLSFFWGKLRGIPWWENFSWANAGFGLLLGGFIFLLALLMIKLLLRYPVFQLRFMLEVLLYPLISSLSGFQLILLCCLSGLAEEIFFRGILQAEIGIILSSLVFAFLHTGDKKLWFSGLWAGLAGCLLGFIYLRTGNLLLIILLHSSYNLLGVLYLTRLYRRLKK